MNLKKQWKRLVLAIAVFLAACYLPVESVPFRGAIMESLRLVRSYAREHVVFCLIPAFFIAGAISVFISRESVIRYLGAGANKVLAYGVASTSGGILAVCSCTVLPLFAGIYRMGAGLGPATAFLYSGPAINVLAIVLTARVLGLELGVARGVGAVLFSVVIGLLMHLIFRGEESEKQEAPLATPESKAERPLWQNAVYFASMVGILVFANWSEPAAETGLWASIHALKWYLSAGFGVLLAVVLVVWLGLRWWKVLAAATLPVLLALVLPDYPAVSFVAAVVGLSVIANSSGGEPEEWLDQTWSLARQILPLLLVGVLIAGALLGRPGHEGLIPSRWVESAVGGNSIRANAFAAVAGAFMYFATLTEVPILQGLLGAGMGKGPALALLLAGPALSLPNMLVIRSVMGTRKTVVYVILVATMATLCGVIFGAFYA